MKKSPRIAGITMSLIMSLFLSGCGQGSLTIENHDWTFFNIQSGADGSIIACSDEKASIYDSAEIMNLDCEAENGVLRVINRDSDEKWELPYSVNTVKPEDSIYDISNGDKSGFASVGVTKYQDGKSEYTLIISIDGYNLYFYEPIE